MDGLILRSIISLTLPPSIFVLPLSLGLGTTPPDWHPIWLDAGEHDGAQRQAAVAFLTLPRIHYGYIQLTRCGESGVTQQHGAVINGVIISEDSTLSSCRLVARTHLQPLWWLTWEEHDDLTLCMTTALINEPQPAESYRYITIIL